MNQESWGFDPITLQKIARGFGIALGAAIFSGFTVLVPEVNDFIVNNDPINWRPVALTAWGSLSGGLINFVREWAKGV